MAIASRLRRHQPDHTLIRQELQCIHEYIHEIAVFVSPPEQDYIDDIVVLQVNEFRFSDDSNTRAKFVIAVVVISNLLNDLAGSKAKSHCQSAGWIVTSGCLIGTRCCCHAKSISGVSTGPNGWAMYVVHRTRTRDASILPMRIRGVSFKFPQMLATDGEITPKLVAFCHLPPIQHPDVNM